MQWIFLVLLAVLAGHLAHELTHAAAARLLGSSDVRIAWRKQTTYFKPIDPRRDRYVQLAPVVVSIVMLPFVVASFALVDSMSSLALIGFWVRYSWTSKSDIIGAQSEPASSPQSE